MEHKNSSTVCDVIRQSLTNVHSLPESKRGRSQSVQLLLDFKPQKFNIYGHNIKSAFLKLFDTESQYKTGLFYELNVYKLISLLVYSNSSPFFVKFLGRLPPTCDINQMSSYKIPRNKFRSMTGILTEKIENGILMFDLLNRLRIINNNIEMTNICLQVLVAIYQMENILELGHNDIHTNNIMVQELPHVHYTKHVIYEKGKKYIIPIKSKYMVKLFDWDRSYSSFTGTNRLLDDDESLCGTYNQCNKFVPFKDTHHFMCDISQYLYSFLRPVYEKYKNCFQKCFDMHRHNSNPRNEFIYTHEIGKKDLIEGNCKGVTTLGIINDIIKLVLRKYDPNYMSTFHHITDENTYHIDGERMKRIIHNERLDFSRSVPSLKQLQESYSRKHVKKLFSNVHSSKLTHLLNMLETKQSYKFDLSRNKMFDISKNLIHSTLSRYEVKTLMIPLPGINRSLGIKNTNLSFFVYMCLIQLNVNNGYDPSILPQSFIDMMKCIHRSSGKSYDHILEILGKFFVDFHQIRN